MAATILIAEDEPFIIESLTFLLTRAGYAVGSVDDGAEVLERAAQVRPDLLILDVMMPSANGFDVLSRLRADPDLVHTPVLVLTAKGQEVDRARMTALGADDFVTKPFSNADLVGRVAQLLKEGRGPRRDLSDGVPRRRVPVTQTQRTGA